MTTRRKKEPDAVERIYELEKELFGLLEKAGLISISRAQKLRNVSRAAILSLIERRRIRSVKAMGRTWVFEDEIRSFERDKPGPRTGTTRETNDEDEKES